MLGARKLMWRTMIGTVRSQFYRNEEITFRVADEKNGSGASGELRCILMERKRERERETRCPREKGDREIIAVSPNFMLLLISKPLLDQFLCSHFCTTGRSCSGTLRNVVLD